MTAARDFDTRRAGASTDEAFDALDPVQWPRREGEAAERARFFADGGFFTPDRKARFVAPEAAALQRRPRADCRSCSTPAACATSGTP